MKYKNNEIEKNENFKNQKKKRKWKKKFLRLSQSGKDEGKNPDIFFVWLANVNLFRKNVKVAEVRCQPSPKNVPLSLSFQNVEFLNAILSNIL